MKLLSDIEVEYRIRREWGERRSEGFFWALGVFYYGRYATEEGFAAAEVILDRHRLIDFPLGIS